MDRLKNIVVGVDFSRHSKGALAQAMRIARWNAAKLHVIHVIEPTLATNLADAYGVPQVDTWDGFQEVARERTLKMISSVQELTTPTGQGEPPEVQAEVDVLFGNPFVHMLRWVRDVSAELFVLGSNGSSDPAKGPGRLATKCVRRTPTKVMLVRELSPEPFKQIVACVGFSDTCRLVVDQAIRVAHRDQASLHVLHVYGSSREIPPPSGPAPEAPPESQPQRKHDCERRLREFLPPFGPGMGGLKVVCHPAGNLDRNAAIVEFVRSAGADLVVLGTRGRTKLKGVVTETTAERIVRDAGCSVLVIKPPDFTYDVGGAARSR